MGDLRRGKFFVTNGVGEGATPEYPGHIAYSGRTASGTGNYSYEAKRGTESWSQNSPFLIFEMIGKADAEELQIYARDNRDATAQRLENRWSTPAGPWRSGGGRLVYIVPLNFPKGAVIALDIVVTRASQFEFLVPPPGPALKRSI